MNKISRTFLDIKLKEKKSIITFIPLGTPSLNESIEMAEVLQESGVDILVLGIPFSDPLVDGPVIQDSYNIALSSGITLSDTIECISKITSKVTIPIVVKAYYNSIYSRGVEKYIKELKMAGVSGMIIPDISLEEREEVYNACKESGILLIPIVAQTSRERINKITEDAEGFIYCMVDPISLDEEGIILDVVKEYLDTVIKSTNTPICVGLERNSLNIAKEISKYCNGIVINDEIAKIVISNEELESRKSEIYDFISKVRKKYKE